MDTTFKIWNFGTPGTAGSGMSVSYLWPAIEVVDNANDNSDSDGTISLKHMATGNANKKYVLVNDIVLAGTWTPKGTGSGAINPFKGTFYGNGHTISGLNPEPGPSTGLFGSIDGAEIRDLKVVIDAVAALSGTVQYLGGIAGSAKSSKLRNLIVEVPQGRVLGFTSASTSAKAAGGIAGDLTDTTIDNCRAEGAGTLSVSSGAPYQPLYAGGIAGFLHGSSGIRDCSVSLAVKAEGTAGFAAEVYGGGIVASLETTSSTLSYAVSRCLMSGEVSAIAASNVQLYAGGAVSRCGNPSLIDHITVSGTVTMNKGAFTRENYCGGIIGYNEQTSIEDCEFSGEIVIPEDFAASGETFIGGIAGRCVAGSVGPGIRNSVASGDLNIQSRGTGLIRTGGVFGYVAGESSTVKVEVENCRYERGDIVVERSGTTGNLHTGGFAGYLGAYSELSNCRSLAGTVSAHSGYILVTGGFVGVLGSASLDGCYAVTDVFSTGTGGNDQYTGGLAGQTFTNSEISRCYAAGSVQASSTGGANGFYTGGLVGTVVNTNISDSYALGDVLADKTAGNGAVHAGGIAGYSSNGTIERCFSAGTVTARSNGGGLLYAGGILGQSIATPTLQNNAALGASVTVKGSGTKHIGRVYGSAAGTTSDNYAVYTLLLFSDTYNYPSPGTVSPSANATGKDGADAADSTLRGGAFWTGLGFSSGWDFSRVYSKRHPALAGLGGQS
jgi:hypothetical protein